MNKVNSGYASAGRVKRGGIFAVGFILLGLLLLPAQTGWADPTPTLTVTRSIGQNAFRADAYSDLGSGYAAGETLQVTLTVTASEAVTLEGFQIAEKVPSGWSLTEAESGDFIYKSQGDIYNLIIKPSFFTDNESWLTFAAGQGKPLTYKVKPDSASHAVFPLAAFSTSNLNNGTIAETEVSGYAIFGPDLGENGVLSRDKDKVTLDYDVPEGAIVHEWRSADQAGSLLGIGNPLVKNLAGSLTVADPVLAYRVNLTNLVGTQIPAAAVPAVTSKLLEVEGMYYAIPGDTVSLDVAAPQGTFFKDAFRDNVEPEDNFTTPALSGTFVVGTGENAVEYTCWQFTMPAEVVNIEAICAPKYTLTFADIQIGDYFAGDAIDTAAIPNYTPPATMVLTGYDAPEGWGEDIDFSCDLDSVPCTISIPQMPAENVTITPIFRGVSILRQVYASPYPVYQAGETTDIAYWLYVPEELWQKNPLITIEDILPTAWDIDETEKSPEDWTLLVGDNQLQITFTAQVESQSDGFDSITEEQFFVYDHSAMLNPGTAGRLFALVWQVTPCSSAGSDELAKKVIDWPDGEYFWKIETAVPDELPVSEFSEDKTLAAIPHASGVTVTFANARPTDEEQILTAHEIEFFQETKGAFDSDDFIVDTNLNPGDAVEFAVDPQAGYFLGELKFSIASVDPAISKTIAVRVAGENLAAVTVNWENNDYTNIEIKSVAGKVNTYSFTMPDYSFSLEALCNDSVVPVTVDGTLADIDKPVKLIDDTADIYSDYAPIYYVTKGAELRVTYQMPVMKEGIVLNDIIWTEPETWNYSRINDASFTPERPASVGINKKQGHVTFTVLDEAMTVAPIIQYPVIFTGQDNSGAEVVKGTWYEAESLTGAPPAGRKIHTEAEVVLSADSKDVFTSWELATYPAGLSLMNNDDDEIALTANELNFVMPAGAVILTAQYETRVKFEFADDCVVTVDGEEIDSGDYIAVGAEVSVTYSENTVAAFKEWEVTLPAGKELTFAGEPLGEEALQTNPLVFEMPDFPPGVVAITKGLSAKRSFWNIPAEGEESVQVFKYTVGEEMIAQVTVSNDSAALTDPLEVSNLTVVEVLPAGWKLNLIQGECKDANGDPLDFSFEVLLDDAIIFISVNSEEPLAMPVTFQYQINPPENLVGDQLALWSEDCLAKWGEELAGKTTIGGSKALRSYWLRYNSAVIDHCEYQPGNDFLGLQENEDGFESYISSHGIAEDGYKYLTLIDDDLIGKTVFHRITDGSLFEAYIVVTENTASDLTEEDTIDLYWLSLNNALIDAKDISISGEFNSDYWLLTKSEDGDFQFDDLDNVEERGTDNAPIYYVKSGSGFDYAPAALTGKGNAGDAWRVEQILIKRNFVDGAEAMPAADYDNTQLPYSLTATMPGHSIDLSQSYTYKVKLNDGLRFSSVGEDMIFADDDDRRGIIFAEDSTESMFVFIGERVEFSLPLLPAGIQEDPNLVSDPASLPWNLGSENPSFNMPDEMVTIGLDLQLAAGLDGAIVKEPADDPHWEILSIEPTIDGVILTAQANEGYYYLSGWSVTYTVLEEQGEGQNPLAVEKKRDFEAEEGSFELNLSEILALENLLLEDGSIKVSADFVWPTATREFQAGKYVVGEPLQVKLTFAMPEGYPTINSFVLNERLPIDGAAPTTWSWTVLGGSDTNQLTDKNGVEIDIFNFKYINGLITFEADVNEETAYPLSFTYTVKPSGQMSGIQTWTVEQCIVAWAGKFENEEEFSFENEIAGQYQISNLALTVADPLLVLADADDEAENALPFWAYAEGDMVYILAPTSNADGWLFKEIHAVASDEEVELELALTPAPDTRYLYSFTMPDCDVELTTEYIEAAPVALPESGNVEIADADPVNYHTDREENRYYIAGKNVTLEAPYIIEDGVEAAYPVKRLVSLKVVKTQVDEEADEVLVAEFAATAPAEGNLFSAAFMMPAYAVTVIEEYANLHRVTVAGGSFTGTDPAVTAGYFAAGDQISITAGESPVAGEAFVRWDGLEEVEDIDITSEVLPFVMIDAALTIEAAFKPLTAERSFATSYYTAGDWLTVIITVNKPEKLLIDEDFTLTITDNYPAWSGNEPRVLDSSLFGKNVSFTFGSTGEFKITGVWDGFEEIDLEDLQISYKVWVPANTKGIAIWQGKTSTHSPTRTTNEKDIEGQSQIAHFSVLPGKDSIKVGDLQNGDGPYTAQITHRMPADARVHAWQLQQGETNTGADVDENLLFTAPENATGEYTLIPVYEYPVVVEIAAAVISTTYYVEGTEASIPTDAVIVAERKKFSQWSAAEGLEDFVATATNPLLIASMPSNKVVLTAEYVPAIQVSYVALPADPAFSIDPTWEIEDAAVFAAYEREGYVFQSAAIGDLELELVDGAFVLGGELFGDGSADIEVTLTYSGIDAIRSFGDLQAWTEDGVEVTLTITRPVGLPALASLNLTEYLPADWEYNLNTMQVEGLEAGDDYTVDWNESTNSLKLVVGVIADAVLGGDWETLVVSYNAKPVDAPKNFAEWGNGGEAKVAWSMKPVEDPENGENGDEDELEPVQLVVYEKAIEEAIGLPYKWQLLVHGGDYSIVNDDQGRMRATVWADSVAGEKVFVYWRAVFTEELTEEQKDQNNPSYISFILDQDVELWATFAYYVELADAVNGSVSGDDIDDAGYATSYSDVTIATDPTYLDGEQNYKFVAWQGLDEEWLMIDAETSSSLSDNPLTFNMPAEKITAKAVYAEAYEFEGELYYVGETVNGFLSTDDDSVAVVAVELDGVDEVTVSADEESANRYNYSFTMPAANVSAPVAVYGYKVTAIESELVNLLYDDEQLIGFEPSDVVYYQSGSTVSAAAAVEVITVSEDEPPVVTNRKFQHWLVDGVETVGELVIVDETPEAVEGEEAPAQVVLVAYSVVSFEMPAEVANVEAVYAEAFSVTLDDEFLALYVAEETVELAAEVLEGYTFTGWTLSGEDGEPIISDDETELTVAVSEVLDEGENLIGYAGEFAMPSQNVWLTADYSINTYQVAADGFASIEPESVEEDGSYAYGTAVTVTAAVRPGYDFIGWEVEGIELADATVNPVTFNVPAGNVSITAGYVKLFFAVSATDASLLGTVEGEEEGTYEFESEVTATADDAAEGWEFDKWVVTGIELADDSLNPASFTVPANPVSISATYRKSLFAVTAEKATLAPESEDGAYEFESEVTATADDAAEGWEFDKWIVTGIELADDSLNPASFTVPANPVSISATYKKSFFAVSATAATLAPESEDGAYEFESTITATADEPAVGWEFDQWVVTGIELEDATIDAEAGTLTFNVPAGDVSITATYRKSFFAVTVTAGTLESDPEGVNGAYEFGSEITATADVPEGYKFVSWTVTGIEDVDLTANPLEFVMPTNVVTLVANFEPLYTVTVNDVDPVPYAEGVTVSIRTAAKDGEDFFKEWEADGLTLTDIQKYNPAFSFAMPANDVVLTAVYSETAPFVITLLTGADEGTITDANWTSSANWTYIFEYSTKLTAELEFPEVTSLEDDFAFDAWKVVASDVEAIEVGAILASLPVDFAGNLTLRVCYVYNKENPNPWYPVLKLAIDDDEQEREVKFYQDGEEVLSLPIVGNKVYPVDYVDAGFAGLSNGDYGVVVENEDEFDITVEYGEPAEPTLQKIDDNGNVFALEADISNASYFTVTVLREGGRVYRPEVKYSFAELEDGITEAGLVATSAEFMVEIYSLGMFQVIVKGGNPEGVGAEKIFDLEVLTTTALEAEEWLASEDFQPAFGEVLILNDDRLAVSFEWPALLDATAYRMILRKGNQVIDTYDGDDDFTFHLVNLEAGEYTWQIIASYENGSALTSATQLFQVIDGSVKPVLESVTRNQDNNVVLKLAQEFTGDVSYQIVHYIGAENRLAMPPIVINVQNPSEGIIVDLVDDAAAGDFLLVRCYVNGVAVDEEYLVYMIK